jgi:RNA polymerase sigma-70 factor (ECF subfamily)
MRLVLGPSPQLPHPDFNPPALFGIIFVPEMKMSAVVSDTIGQYPSTIGDDRSATLEVVRRAQAGDVAAFENLYREHSGRVFALCLRLKGGDREDATELLQDVFVRAWRRLETFRGDSAFSSWLHRLAVNTMLENARSERRRTARVLAMEDTSTLPGAARSSGVDLKLEMEEAVASLPKGARIAFVLHDIEGYQHQEIAEQLSVSVGTVKAQLHRARRLLRARLEGRPEGESQ